MMIYMTVYYLPSEQYWLTSATLQLLERMRNLCCTHYTQTIHYRCNNNHINNHYPIINQYLLNMLSNIISLILIIGSVFGQDQEALEGLEANIPGLPGQDYPIFAFPPETSFICDDHIQGYYGDPEADCRSSCSIIYFLSIYFRSGFSYLRWWR